MNCNQSYENIMSPFSFRKGSRLPEKRTRGRREGGLCEEGTGNPTYSRIDDSQNGFLGQALRIYEFGMALGRRHALVECNRGGASGNKSSYPGGEG